ncbi:non-homologous end joining protein Ku [Saccharopolyspora endophytica]|uniref:Non-homologous end joining protein Ku n=1 Tax=Saccharopolyspora endophytica TaxID=543886 RepID=A0ABS5DMM2_9PSEU|nr:Ku protein [Saccharopolyspora endophytica]MBQ0927539.1 Ku protein [Saccharopolyspora endophytica]
MTLPVQLFTATEDHTVRFHQYERGTTDRIRYQRINERTGREVDYYEIVKGRTVQGRVVTVEDSELDEIAPGRSRSISITAFVDVDEINPAFFGRTYWLAPDTSDHRRPYTLLHQAMSQTNRAGIATCVLRGRQHLALVRADEHALALTTLRWPDELRDPTAVLGRSTSGEEPSEDELQAATTVINAMSGPWKPQDYEDTYAVQVEQLLQAKAQGALPAAAPAPPEPTSVSDLERALRASLESATSRRRGA